MGCYGQGVIYPGFIQQCSTNPRICPTLAYATSSSENSTSGGNSSRNNGGNNIASFSINIFSNTNKNIASLREIVKL